MATMKIATRIKARTTTMMTVVFPCDFGCGRLPTEVSVSQWVHHLVGLVTYLTVPPALLWLGATARHWSPVRAVAWAGWWGGAISLVGAWLFLVFRDAAIAGLLQRITEGAVLVWVLIVAVALNHPDRGRSN
jgi:hypothetical protein